MTTVKIESNFLEYDNLGTNYATLTGTSDGLVTFTANAGDVTIAGVANPTTNQQVATKNYVDSVFGAIQYIQASLGSNVAVPADNTKISFDSTIVSDGITNTTGTFALDANKTYKLVGRCQLITTSATVSYQWYDETGAVLIGTPGQAISISNSINNSSIENAEAIFIPTVSTNVHLRITSGGGTTTLAADLTNISIIQIAGRGTLSDYSRTEVNSATYTLTGSDQVVGVIYTPTGTVALALPLISSVGLKRYTIKDEGGNAGSNTITISRSGADTIDGATSTPINTNYGSVEIYNNGSTGWFLTN